MGENKKLDIEKFDREHFCLCLVIYYQRYIKKSAVSETAESVKELFQDLPQVILDTIKLFDCMDIIVLDVDTSKIEMMNQNIEFLQNNITSVFSFSKIFIRYFSYIAQMEFQLYVDLLDQLCLADLVNLERMLYISADFDCFSLMEMLFVLCCYSIERIHIINFLESEVNIQECITQLYNELKEAAFGLLPKMINKIHIVNMPQLNFSYLESYVSECQEKDYVIVIGIERLLEFGKKSDIRVGFLDSSMQLHLDHGLNWKRLIDNMDCLAAISAKNNNFLMMIYLDDNSVGKVYHNIKQYYDCERNNFNLLYFKIDYINGHKVNEDEIIRQILDQSNSYQEIDKLIQNNQDNLSKTNCLLLRYYYFMSQNHYFHAIKMLEAVPEPRADFIKFYLANTYSGIGDNHKAYELLKEIYARDKYFPGLYKEILYSLRDNQDEVEKLLWADRGLQINPDDKDLLQHQANIYTHNGKYLKSAESWKKLYEQTREPFHLLLSEINVLQDAIDQTELKIIDIWHQEKLENYPQFKAEINNRVGQIVYRYKNKEKAMKYFNQIDHSLNMVSYDAAVTKLEFHYHKLFDNTSRKVSIREIDTFAKMLLDNYILLIYGSQATYLGSDFIHHNAAYQNWKCVIDQLLVEYLAKWEENIFKPTNSEIWIDEKICLAVAMAKEYWDKGEIQKANDTAYTLFKLSQGLDDVGNQKLYISFGLLIWSESCFRIGEYLEGAMSFIAAAEACIEQGAVDYLYQFEFVHNMMNYLYFQAEKLELNDSDKVVIKKYVNQLGLNKALGHVICHEYEQALLTVPEQLKEIFDKMKDANIIPLFKNLPADDIIYLDNIVYAYYKRDGGKAAANYINVFFNTILKQLEENPVVVQNVLMRYAEILIAVDEFINAETILKKLVSYIEEQRKNLSFGSQRSFLGERLMDINRKLILCYCKTNNNSDLINRLKHFVPKTLLEEKYQDYEKKVDADLEIAAARYYQLYDIINKKNIKRPISLEDQELIKEFEQKKRFLEENHPSFMPMPYYSLVSGDEVNLLEFISQRLAKEEVFYRQLLIEDYLIHMIVTTEQKSVQVKKIDWAGLETLLFQLEEMIERSVDELAALKEKSYIDLYDQLSNLLFSPILEYLTSASVLYYMPELKLKHISPNFMRKDGKWLIEILTRIELIIDYNDIGVTKSISDSKKVKYYASASAKGKINKIGERLEQSDGFIKINLKPSETIVIEEKLQTLVIVAHGISETYGDHYPGAMALEFSKKQTVSLSDFIILQNPVENILVVACSGGTPVNEKIERSHGVWDAMLKKNVKYILFCKWDVSTLHTGEILLFLLEDMKMNNSSLSMALAKAQRQYMHLNPVLWAGLEVWKNR